MRISTLDRRILAITVPAFAALICEPLMLMADTAIVGHLGRAELAALGAASTVLSTIIGLCVFLAYGSTATVARHQGAGEPRRALEAALGGVWLALLIGLVLGAATAVAARPMARALSSSPAVADLTTEYLRIAAASIPAVLLVLAATGALRGVLDLRTPLVVMIAANVLNVVLTVALVYGAGLDLRGAALGLVLAQWAAALALVAQVLRRSRETEASPRLQWDDVTRAARDGVPLLLRTLSLRAVLLLATLVAAGFGDASLAAHQIATTLVMFLAFALDAFAIAAQTLTGHSLGAGDAEGTRRVTRRVIGWGLGFGVVAGVLLAVTAPWVARAFSPDADVRAAAVPALLLVALIQPLSGIVFVLDGVLIGAGDGVYLAWASLVTLLIYAPIALVIRATDAGFTWLWAAYALFQATRWVTLWLRQRSDRWLVLGST
ncbi:MATE family efflux transporter [Aeromicrobium duanguangcaii]|uniref:MATE family efflux transporter n=1 Tax=Aeromicrobium duanguangcaii TaxID=2968086 RepID=A0ABY5KHH2_9ACTN|nr:MATE family efflux transporter [Aeromicrobium duanguangcaii]MCD9154444.1 MATE family efflux transporter [Aeromicrobium duanguangcaii]MCL3838191.1 MATE family efflux transporter [Aeromicrobium duanguangcaii]UUI68496.1 MATE family efflux transporter [Aeromicrobium duanguangcaii]